MAKPRLVLRTNDSVEDAIRLFESSGLAGAPVISKDERYVGGLDAHALTGKTVKEGSIVEQVMDEALAPAMLETRGSVLLEMLINTRQPWIPIVDGERRIRGIVSASDLVRGYRYTLLRSLRRVSYTGNPDNVLEIPLAQGSPLVNIPLRIAPLPLGVLITQVERGKETFIPTGDTVLLANDRITALGSKDRLAAVRTLLATPASVEPDP
ncbi:MAG: TrkA C-terminal domain-containing protein [Candidatus Dormibacteria bacterium]